MKHTEEWYRALAARLGHKGFTTLAEIRAAEADESTKEGN